MKNSILFVVIGLLLAACQKESLQTTDILNVGDRPQIATDQHVINNGATVSPTLFTPPAQSGPKVFRIVAGIAEIGLIMPDEKSGLTAIVGVDNELFCSTFQLEYDLLPLQDVVGTSRDDRIIRLQKGEVQTLVYEGVWPRNTFICNFTNNSTIVAHGTSQLVITDNDLYPFLTEDNKNHNVASYKVHGNLTDANGGSVRLNAHATFLWDGTNPETIREDARVVLK